MNRVAGSPRCPGTLIRDDLAESREKRVTKASQSVMGDMRANVTFGGTVEADLAADVPVSMLGDWSNEPHTDRARFRAHCREHESVARLFMRANRLSLSRRAGRSGV